MTAPEEANTLDQITLPEGLEHELCSMIIECCSQERTYSKFYGLIGERFAKITRMWTELFEKSFATYYDTIHRYETNRLRNIARFFGHMFSTDALGWHAFNVIHLNEEETTSSSRIFVKILFQDLSEAMGMKKLAERMKDPYLQEAYTGLFPTDNPRNTRFSINYFTSIGMGSLTEGMREWLQNLPKPAPIAPPPAAESDDESVSSKSSYSSPSYISGSSSYSRSRSRSQTPKRKRGRGYTRSPSRPKSRSRSDSRGSRSSYDSYSSRSRSRSRARSLSSDRDRDRSPIRAGTDKRPLLKGGLISCSPSPAPRRRGSDATRLPPRRRSPSIDSRRGRGRDRSISGSRSRGRTPSRSRSPPPRPPPAVGGRGRSHSSSMSRSRSPSRLRSPLPPRKVTSRRSYSLSRSRSRSPPLVTRRNGKMRAVSRSRSPVAKRGRYISRNRSRTPSRDRRGGRAGAGPRGVRDRRSASPLPRRAQIEVRVRVVKRGGGGRARAADFL